MLTNLQLQSILREAGIDCPILFADGDYDLPGAGWHKALAPHLGRFLEDLQYVYTDEARDCDDFARTAAWYAQLVHAKNRGETRHTALAVGEFWFLPQNPLDGHAIVVALEGPTPGDVKFYEPQFGRGAFSPCLQPLNPQPQLQEITSVFCRF